MRQNTQPPPLWNGIVGMANFARFATFLLFFHQSGSEWLGMANFTWFAIFQIFSTIVPQNDSERPISPDSQLFRSFPTEVAQNDSEQPISPDSQFFRSFPTEVAQIMRQCTWNGIVGIQFFRFQLGFGPVLGWWSLHPGSLGHSWCKLLL